MVDAKGTTNLLLQGAVLEIGVNGREGAERHHLNDHPAWRQIGVAVGLIIVMDKGFAA